MSLGRRAVIHLTAGWVLLTGVTAAAYLTADAPRSHVGGGHQQQLTLER